MAQIYLTKEVAELAKTDLTIKLTMPRGYSKLRWAKRFFVLKARNYLRNFEHNKPELIMLITKVITDWQKWRNVNEYMGGTYLAPDGRTFLEGQKAYWVADHGHPPFGVCPVCLSLEKQFRTGGDPKLLWQLMMDPQHIAIHVDSRVKRPICYCQIMPYAEVNQITPKAQRVTRSIFVNGRMPHELKVAIANVTKQYVKRMHELANSQTHIQIMKEKNAMLQKSQMTQATGALT